MFMVCDWQLQVHPKTLTDGSVFPRSCCMSFSPWPGSWSKSALRGIKEWSDSTELRRSNQGHTDVSYAEVLIYVYHIKSPPFPKSSCYIVMLQWACLICPWFLASGLGFTFWRSEETTWEQNDLQNLPFPVGWTILNFFPSINVTVKNLSNVQQLFLSISLSVSCHSFTPRFLSQLTPTCWPPRQRCVRKKRTDFSLLSVSDRKISGFFQDKNSRSFSRCLFISLIFLALSLHASSMLFVHVFSFERQIWGGMWHRLLFIFF